MTTTVKVHVNGRYRATVRQNGAPIPIIVEGNYEGSPNPSGEHTFWLSHYNPTNTFEITEEYVPEGVHGQTGAPPPVINETAHGLE